MNATYLWGRGRCQREHPAGWRAVPPSPPRHRPGHGADPRGSPCRLGEGLEDIRVEEADGPIHRLVHPLVVLLPQVAHLPQQGLLPVHQVLGEQTAVVPPRDPHWHNAVPQPRGFGLQTPSRAPQAAPSRSQAAPSSGAGWTGRARRTSASRTRGRRAERLAPVPPGTCGWVKVRAAVPGPGSASGPENRGSFTAWSCRD